MLRYPLGSCSSLPHGARPASAHRVGVAFSKGPELLPFYAHILSVTFPVLPHTNNFFKAQKWLLHVPWIPGGTRTIPVLRITRILYPAHFYPVLRQNALTCTLPPPYASAARRTARDRPRPPGGGCPPRRDFGFGPRPRRPTDGTRTDHVGRCPYDARIV